MNLEEAYRAIWAKKLPGAAAPHLQSIDRVTWTAGLFPDDPAAGPLLDIGTGGGAMLAEAERHKWKAYGVELDGATARWLGGQGYDVWTLDINTQKTPLADGSVGIVTACDVIEHLLDPFAMLREARRVLRPGGRLYVATPNCSHWRRIVDLACGQMIRTSGDECLLDGGHVAYYAPRSFQKMLEGQGFADVQIHFFKHDPPPDSVLGGLRAIGNVGAGWDSHTYMIANARNMP